MAEHSITLVYGGGRIGLMGIVANSVITGGGEVIGIIPEFLKDMEVGNDADSEQIVTHSMHERKRRMFELSDGFVVLPGGIGTLDETLEIIAWKQLQLHSKPIVIINTGGYWSALADLVNSTIDGGFAHSGVNELFTMVENADDVLSAFKSQPKPKKEVLTSHL